MRFSIWIPQTLLGVLASILAGLTIAAVLWFGVRGAPIRRDTWGGGPFPR
jgi:hypothetical protein